MKQCEAKTSRGARCKVTKNLIYLRHDVAEYLCCPVHCNIDFRPYKVADKSQWAMDLADTPQATMF